MNRRHLLKLSAAAAAAISAGIAPAAFAAESEGQPKSRAILIYFSRTGSTAEIARIAAEITGADVLELKLREPYADSYAAMTDIARSERASNARREIATAIPDLSGYDTVILGSPYWWGGLSIPIRTFLMDHPLDGKRILPFCVSASSSPSGAWRDLREFCPKAQIAEGFHTTEARVSGSRSRVETWLKANGF